MTVSDSMIAGKIGGLYRLSGLSLIPNCFEVGSKLQFFHQALKVDISSIC